SDRVVANRRGQTRRQGKLSARENRRELLTRTGRELESDDAASGLFVYEDESWCELSRATE
ncbi:MAG: hypothetical protein ACREQ5_33230, partial [Candidatus Dormibacteria bacterium]